MVNQGSLDIESDMVKYCVSTVIQAVAHVGMQRMISAWNAHSIPRCGIPNVLQRQLVQLLFILWKFLQLMRHHISTESKEEV